MGESAEAGAAGPPSLDERIKAQQLAKLQGEVAQIAAELELKRVQRDKLQAELKHLSGITLETGGKLGVTALGIAAAAFTLWAGVPQTKFDLAKAQEELIGKRRELEEKTLLVARKASEAAQKDAEVAQKTALLAETESRQQRAADELARLQDEMRAVAKALEAGRAPAGTPPQREVTQRLAEATRPRVFVQFAGSVDRGQVIDPLREAIAAAGFVVPPAERINKGQANEVRYFSQTPEQRSQAERVAEATRAYLAGVGWPLPSLAARYVDLGGGKQSPIELWLMLRCPAP